LVEVFLTGDSRGSREGRLATHRTLNAEIRRAEGILLGCEIFEKWGKSKFQVPSSKFQVPGDERQMEEPHGKTRRARRQISDWRFEI
jgi:hypothetical protein